jgi:hypothetical protein
MTTATPAAATLLTGAPRPDGLPMDTLMEAPMGHDKAEPTACAVPTVEASGDRFFAYTVLVPALAAVAA